ncbi:hypothetical protein HYV31_01710 [candidate division WWE3 bacterium]|nr:hypothetical protein [candidate division WWE3 bacterium]
MSKSDALKILMVHFVADGTIVEPLKNPHVAIGGSTLADLAMSGWVDVFGSNATLSEQGRNAVVEELQHALQLA